MLQPLSFRALRLGPGPPALYLLRAVPDHAPGIQGPAQNLTHGRRCPRSGATARGGDAVLVQLLGNAGQSVPLGIEREDSAHRGCLDLVNHTLDVPLAVAHVLVAEAPAARDGPGLGPPPEGVICPLPRAPPLEAQIG